MSELGFTKMVATGNDFLIFDMRENSIPFDRARFTKNICDRHFGIGADGVVFVDLSLMSGTQFKWDFYNSDGSVAEFCGNAGRCIAQWSHSKYPAPALLSGEKIRFETMAGVIWAQIKNETVVTVGMPPFFIHDKELKITLPEGSNVDVFFVDTGVPHAVLETKDWNADLIFELGSAVRHHSAFKKTNGANATFFEIKTPTTVQSATFERGVEQVTLSCGTGAVAAALAARVKGMRGTVNVETPGGPIQVEIDLEKEASTLTGEAHRIFDGVIEWDNFL